MSGSTLVCWRRCPLRHGLRPKELYTSVAVTPATVPFPMATCPEFHVSCRLGLEFFMLPSYKKENKGTLYLFSGSNYNVTDELEEMQAAVNEQASNRVSLKEAFSTRAAKKGLMIAFGLMIFQQLSGVNAVIFYTADIFKVSWIKY